MLPLRLNSSGPPRRVWNGGLATGPGVGLALATGSAIGGAVGGVVGSAMILTWATTAAKYPLAWLKPEPVRPATEPAKRQTPIAWTVLPTNRMSARVANQTSFIFFGRDASQDEGGRPFFTRVLRAKSLMFSVRMPMGNISRDRFKEVAHLPHGCAGEHWPSFTEPVHCSK